MKERIQDKYFRGRANDRPTTPRPEPPKGQGKHPDNFQCLGCEVEKHPPGFSGKCPKCAEKDKELVALKKWVDDLQSGMFINCVYCGHRYGPKKDMPVAMADVLKAHVEKCPKHPMSQLRVELAAFKKRVVEALGLYCHGDDTCNCRNKQYRANCQCYACRLYRDCQEPKP